MYTINDCQMSTATRFIYSSELNDATDRHDAGSPPRVLLPSGAARFPLNQPTPLEPARRARRVTRQGCEQRVLQQSERDNEKVGSEAEAPKHHPDGSLIAGNRSV